MKYAVITEHTEQQKNPAISTPQSYRVGTVHSRHRTRDRADAEARKVHGRVVNAHPTMYVGQFLYRR